MCWRELCGIPEGSPADLPRLPRLPRLARTLSVAATVRAPARTDIWRTGSVTKIAGSCMCAGQNLAVTGSGIREHRWRLKACPDKAARGVPTGGLRPVSLVSSGVMVASASAMLARECGARCGHFVCAYATACWYQVTVTGSGVAHVTGSPVAGSNSTPVRGRAARPNPVTGWRRCHPAP